MAHALGRHVLAELYDCDRDKLDDVAWLKRQAVAAAEAMGATVMGAHSHRYEPHGVSVVLILAESHLSLHTWPEHGLASLDVFVCNPDTDPEVARDHLVVALEADRIAELAVDRGHLEQVTGRLARMPARGAVEIDQRAVR